MRSRREEEFRAFCLATRPSLIRTATFLTGGDRHFAEDLVQITLVRVYVAWSRVRPERGAVAFARRVLTNAFIDERRRPSARLEHSVGELPDTVAIGEAPARADELQRALMALSPGMRAAVVLRHIETVGRRDGRCALLFGGQREEPDLPCARPAPLPPRRTVRDPRHPRINS